ncbi:NAD(P)-binding domain-containing protein [Micromonospora sp. WMMD987]|uniref:NAD(P)-dependent oxidoreductase n=1 Tax=Micromonospora sp. WMMD987 TaxID=3016089 RepID=UPI00249BEB84|nr:NAD(P)-binding domain-containing protein [Micromonospora sp. WMMD987]WFE94686.1 NAD(P)-binding domain-containing protein [Micromonospora sp. WMMD987]
MSDRQLTYRDPVAVLGLGPMGRALAATLISAGIPTTVWNRTPHRAEALVARGATAASTVTGAVRAAALVVTCLRNPAAVDSVLAGHGDWAGRTVVDVTTSRPDEARRLSDWADGHRVHLVKGAILTPTPTIGTPAAITLWCGDRPAFDAALPVLATFGGAPAHLGTDPGAAAAYDMALLDLFGTAVSGLTHAFALASAEGVAPRSFARYAAGIAPMLGEMTTRFADQLTEERFPGDRSTIASAHSGITHVIETADTHGIDSAVLRAARSVIAEAVTAGHGEDGLARLARFLTPACSA